MKRSFGYVFSDYDFPFGKFILYKRFEKEAETWRRLKHPHVLEFLGTYKPEGHIYFVSPFAKSGTLLEYIIKGLDINRVRLLCETSDAIDYLHRENFVHGDIKASNLFISGDGHVLLCDFGLAKPTYAQTSTALQGERWNPSMAKPGVMGRQAQDLRIRCICIFYDYRRGSHRPSTFLSPGKRSDRHTGCVSQGRKTRSESSGVQRGIIQECLGGC
ncbi:hypothetical protein M407DRAFT_231554 [Tulasnella calospora MUT 4182]|uniref:non-specific serine/threonine protein kinase n=1 Tax=Tulasnella calospora MUT 4182 TaxID=1051891 RepID=A0A0C3Q2E1_9AGAM|nr:hypothetical protein M407DRAFT_231554 [Tulasnella calospora MUT 4182]